MYDICMFFNFNLNIHMLYNEIITCICPLIQKVPIDFNCTQSHFSWLNCITWHTALVQDVTHNPLPVTHHHVLSHSLPGVGRFNPHIIVYIFTIHWGLPSPPFFESSFTSGYSRLRCACDLGNVPWGMVGCTGFRIMGAGPKIRHVSTT